jgi:hypothetical protein
MLQVFRVGKRHRACQLIQRRGSGSGWDPAEDTLTQGGIVNWKDFLKEVSTKVVAGVVVLALGSIAVWIWPPLRQWTIGHQNEVYAFLALIVGIAIGLFSNTLRTSKTTIESKPTFALKSDGARLDRVANLFWLGSDLQWARQMVDHGSQDNIEHGLKQAYHHSSELGLSTTPAGQQLLDHRTSVEKLPPKLTDKQKSWVVGLIDSDLTSFSNLMIHYQPDFKPDPYHS